jgi:small multidrug resistance family-3 protein
MLPVLRRNGSAWLLLSGAASLAVSVRLLTLHPTASGRITRRTIEFYAVATLWQSRVDRVPLTNRDLFGASIAFIGVCGIVWGGVESEFTVSAQSAAAVVVVPFL